MWSREESHRCPACGSETARGQLTVASSRGAVLFWRSDAKIPRKRPFKLFKIDFLQRKAVRVNLIAATLTLVKGDPEEHVPAWYCPNCRKIFPWFDAPDVPPELCQAEAGRPVDAKQ